MLTDIQIKAAKLSLSMRHAVRAAEEGGGRLVLRWRPGDRRGRRGEELWMTEGPNPRGFCRNPTIQALVDLGLAEHTDWENGRPIQVTLIDKGL